MATFTEPTRPLEFLLSEGNGQISREKITIKASSGALGASRVLAKETATGKYVAYDDASATAGVNVADAVLCYDVPNSASDQTATAIVRLAEVKAAALDWGTNNAGGITNGTADLAAKLILARAA